MVQDFVYPQGPMLKWASAAWLTPNFASPGLLDAGLNVALYSRPVPQH